MSEKRKKYSSKPEIMYKYWAQQCCFFIKIWLLRNLGSNRTPWTGSEAFTDLLNTWDMREWKQSYETPRNYHITFNFAMTSDNWRRATPYSSAPRKQRDCDSCFYWSIISYKKKHVLFWCSDPWLLRSEAKTCSFMLWTMNNQNLKK